MAVVVEMLKIVLTSAEPITGTFMMLICPCWCNFTFKTIIYAILCCFTCFFKLFHCGHGGEYAENSAEWCWANRQHISKFNLPMLPYLWFWNNHKRHFLAIFNAFSFFFQCHASLSNAKVYFTIASLIFLSKFTFKTLKNPILNHFYHC